MMFFQRFVAFCLFLSGARHVTAARQINARQKPPTNPYATVSLALGLFTFRDRLSGLVALLGTGGLVLMTELPISAPPS